MIVRTESGAVYDIRDGLVRREGGENPLRRDGEFRPMVVMSPPVVGERLRIMYEPGGIATEGIVTFRETTPVVSISEPDVSPTEPEAPHL